jgi:hypothetical protein
MTTTIRDMRLEKTAAGNDPNDNRNDSGYLDRAAPIESAASHGDQPGKFKPKTIEEILAQDDPEWLVHDLLPHKGVALLFGESHAGKTFCVLDMASAIARGIPWFGRDVDEPTGVLYVAGEGSMQRRLRAHLNYHDVTPDDLSRLRFVTRPVNLLEQVEVDALLFELRGLAEQLGRVGLVILDTYARMTPGSDEGRKDTGTAIQACDQIRDELNCCVLLVHHPGYGNLERVRGSSSLYAALDAELHLDAAGKATEDTRTLAATKVREGRIGPLGGFQLEVVELGEDAKGRPVTSCAVRALPADACLPVRRKRAQELKPRQKLLLDALNEVLTDREARKVSGVAHQRLGARLDQYIAPSESVRERFYPRLDGVKPVDRRKAYSRTVEQLQSKQVILAGEDALWLAPGGGTLPGQAGQS